MAKNSICCKGLPEEESFAHDYHATVNTMQLQDCAANGNARHRVAEKRRRDRINAQLSRLRKLIPKSEKMEKAALLERVIHEIEDLKSNALEVSKFHTIPTETDDITIECDTNLLQQYSIAHDDQEDKKKKKVAIMIKVSICCDDRPDLISDLNRAVKGLNLATVGADMASLGGRIKTILILNYQHDDKFSKGENKDGKCNVTAIKQSLMAILTRVISWSTSSSNFRVSSKRQRFFFSS